MIRVVTILFLLMCLTAGFIGGQTGDPRCHRSTEGKEFWFGFMEGRNNSGNKYLEITVTAREGAGFSIYIGKSATAFYTGNVQANNSVQVRIPKNLAEPTGSETIQEKGIRLVADKPVNVYALNWDMNSADVAVIYPSESIGTEYFAMCFEPNIHDNVNHGRNSEFLIVAAHDVTKITITPSKITDAGRPANLPFSITLNKGEVYQVQSANQRNLFGQGDLTGSYIESDKPVAVYSGSYSTTVPAESGMSGYDHLYEQVPPVPAWGREYYAVPLLTRQADRYRVMASADKTRILIGNRPPVLLNKGEFHEFLLSNNEPSRIFADKPVMVAQFSQSNNTDRNYTGGSGDPFMIILSPVSQSKNDVTFVTYNSNQIRTYYVNVVTLTTEVGNIELDGVLISGQFRPFSGTKYSYAQVVIGPGTYRLRNRNPNRGFLAYVYGYGGFESYGYGVGFNLDLVLDLGQSIDFQGDTIALCFGNTLTLDAGPYFDNFIWNTGDITQELTVTKQGLYSATATTIDGCIQHDEIYVLVSQPETDIGGDISECAPFNLQLDGGSVFAHYEWSTGEKTQKIIANKTGQYSVTVYDEYGCPASDAMQLVVFPVPNVDIAGKSLVCGSKTEALQVNFSGTADEVWKTGTFTWKTNQPAKLSFENPTVSSSGILVSDWGKYDINYELTTTDGCKTGDSFTLSMFETPTSDFVFADDPNDKCKGYDREILYTGNATSAADFFWDTGGSTITATPDWNKLRVSVGVFNSNPFISLVVEENGCWSETTRKAIGANPDFTMNTLKSGGCDMATIYFHGELKVPDDLRFEWDFGDGSPVSNLQNPIHFYSGTGKYDVGLLITNQLTGCKTGFLVKEMVKIFPTPVAKIAVDTEICHDQTADLFYDGSIDSSLCYWEFEGARKIGNGNDSITILLESQVATIRLRVDEFGCLSNWVETTAKRKPVFDFNPDIDEGCQPLRVFAQSSTDDQFIEFEWITDSIITKGSEYYVSLPDSGIFELELAAYSSLTGCRDTLLKNDLIRVFPKPLADFDVDYPVAIIGQSDLRFTNKTLLANNFYWEFDDGFTSSERNPRHNFTEMGKYSVQMEAESQFGCLDTAYMDIEILPFDVYTPNAFRPDSDIPENRVFMPISIGVDPLKFHLQVFNRWGEVVFESKDPGFPWDGKLRNASPAPLGNYVWKADYTDIQGFRHTMKGQVLLIR